MKILRISIYQPQAHYRIPFTYQRRHTYPIPPYSTIIGFLCNALGIDDQKAENYRRLQRLKMAIAGKFASKTTEFIWFRNLSLKKHIDRFGYAENRFVGGHIEHIGQQSPMRMDVLNDVFLKIYLASEEEAFLDEIRDSIANPIRRLEVLHIGRAEDWIVLEEKPKLLAEDSICFKRRDANYGYFFWIPQRLFLEGYDQINDSIFENVDGLLYNLTTFWDVADFDTTFNRHGERNFEFMRTKLNDGLLRGEKFLIDTEFNMPIFLADFEKEREQV